MKTVASSIALCAALMASGTVSASAYVVSTNTITDFSLSFTGSTTFYGFAFSSTTAALNGIGAGSGGTLDAAATCISCGYNNSFATHGMLPTDYAYGDAQIVSTNVLGGVGSASSIGESQVSNGIGSASGVNTMIASFYVPIGTTSVAAFSFNADPYMQAMLSAGGQTASATTNFTITISNGLTNVFSWAPDGIIGSGIFGGSENYDPFNLNHGIGRVISEGLGSVIYDQTKGTFTATTNSLSSGSYTLNITAKDSSFVSAAAVPVPAAVWLLGSGLIGLVGVARRKAA